MSRLVHCGRFQERPLTRRAMLSHCANGFGAIALFALFGDTRTSLQCSAEAAEIDSLKPRAPQYPAKVVAVGTPVTRRPPHRSRRAVFPHRALQINSLSHTPKKRVGPGQTSSDAGTNSAPVGKALSDVSFPQSAVAGSGNARKGDRPPLD